MVAWLALALACGGSGDSDIEILPREKMVAILCDIHVLEVKLGRMHMATDTTHKIYNTFEKELLVEHGTNKEIYDQSFEYYMAHPEQLEKIYEIVVDSLNVREQTAVKEEELEKEAKRNSKKATSRPKSSGQDNIKSVIKTKSQPAAIEKN